MQKLKTNLVRSRIFSLSCRCRHDRSKEKGVNWGGGGCVSVDSLILSLLGEKEERGEEREEKTKSN